MVQYDVNDLIKTLLNLDLDNAESELLIKLEHKINNTMWLLNKENSIRNDGNV